MIQILKNNQQILMEAAIVERLRRSTDVKLHPDLIHAPLIYDEKGKKALIKLYQEYVSIAYEARMPVFLCAPTWRANYARVHQSAIAHSINSDAVHFLQEFRDSQVHHKSEIIIGGMLGCKNDCYKPDEALSVSEAQLFHTWQIEQLVLGGVDCLIAVTLPNVDEALGIAKAMQATGIPYIISFVISRDGCVLDGTNLNDAVHYIDNNTTVQPLGYMVNCAFPSFLCPDQQPKQLFERLIGYQANASSLDHCDLDGANKLEADELSEWGNLMIELNSKYGMKILGGCCGTDGDHLRYIVEHKKTNNPK